MAITSTLIKSFQLSALTTALALAGCGGGGGNDNLPPPMKTGTVTVTNASSSADATTAAKLTKVTKVQVISDSSQFYMSNGETITLTAYALDKNNLGVAGVPVEVTIPDPSATGVFSATPAALITDDTGKAIITLNVKALTEAQKTELRKGLTISAKVGTQTGSKTLTGSDFKPSTTTPNTTTTSSLIVLSNSSTIAMAAGNKITITAIALDKDNNVIPNKTVTFKLADSSANTGIFPNGSLTATTNDKGEATVELELKSLTDAQKAYLSSTGINISAEADGQIFSNSAIKITGVEASTTPGQKFDVQKINLTMPNSTFNVKVGEKFTVTASVLNSNNVGFGGVPVQFKLLDDPSVTGIYSVSDLSNVVTNANGEATIELEVKSEAFKDYLINKGINIQATAKNTMATTAVEKTGTLNIKGVALSDTPTNVSKVNQVLLTPSATELDLTAGSKLTITANVADAAQGALAGVPVTFTLPSLDQTGVANLSGSVVNTNEKGEATINLEVKSLTTAQRDYLVKNGLTVNASTPNGKIANAINIAAKNIAPDNSVNSVSVIADSDNILMAVGSKVKISAFALDKNNGGLNGQTLKVSLPDPATTGIYNNSGSSVTTDAKGEAVIELEVKSNLTDAQKDNLLKGLAVTVTSANGKVGSTNLIAKAVNLVVANSVNLTSNVNNIPLTVGAQFKVTATVSDAQNGAINDAPVTFNLPALADYGVASLSPSTLTTNAQGQAVITLQVQSLTDAQKANLLKGFTINATSNGKTATALTLKGIDTSAKRFDVKSVKLTSPVNPFNIKTGERFTVTASVLNGNNTGIGGAPVEFKLNTDPSVSGVYAVSDTSNIITNANGEATIELEVKSTVAKDYLMQNGISLQAVAKNTMGDTPADVVGSLTIKGTDPNAIATEPNIAAVAQGALSSNLANNIFDLSVGTTFDVTATIADAKQGALSKVPVTFSLPGLEQTGIANLSGSTVTTDANGKASIKLRIDSLTTTQRQYLLTNGLVVNASVPNGTKINPIKLTARDSSVDTLVTSIVVNADSNDIIMAAGAKVRVTATALNANFGGISGSDLTVSITDPVLTNVFNLSGTTVKTDEKGEAIIDLQVKSTLTPEQSKYLAETGLNVTVKSASGATGNIHLNGRQNSYADFNKLTIETFPDVGQPVELKQGNEFIVLIHALDTQNGAAITNVPVTFELPDPASGFISLSPSTVLTSLDDAPIDPKIGESQVIVPKGTAYIRVRVADIAKAQAYLNQNKGYIVNATSTNKAGEIRTANTVVQFKKESTVTDIAKVNIVTDKNTLTTNTGDTINVTAQVRDANNVSLANMPVTFTLVDPTSAIGITTTTPLEATTNANGEAVLTLKVGALTPDQKYYLQTNGLSFKATAGSITSSTVTLKTQEAITADSVNTLLLTTDSAVQLAIGSKVKVTALAIDKNGAVVPGAQVSFRVPTDSGLVNNTGAVITTNSNGEATVELEVKSLTDAQKALLQNGVSIYAQSGTSAGTTTVQGATSNANIEAYKLFVSPSKTTLRTATDTATLGIKVTDTKGGIKAGAPVQLQIVEGIDQGITFNKTSNLTTDANGFVQVDLVQSDIGLASKLDHTAKIKVIVNDGVYQQAEQTIDFTVTGTNIRDSLISKAVITDSASDTVTVSGVAVDGNNKPLTNQSIQLLNDGDTLAVTPAITDSTGKFTFTLNGSQLPAAVTDFNLQARIVDANNPNLVSQPYNLGSLTKVTASNLSLTVTQNSIVGDEVKVDTPASVTIDLPNTVADGTTVYLTTNKGSLGSNNASRVSTTVQGGKAIFNDLRSISPGVATLAVEYNGTKQLEHNITYITDKVTKVLTQVTNTTVSTNGETKIIATVRDDKDAPVKNAVVDFTLLEDASSGKLSTGTAITDDAGNATISYFAGATSTPVNGVKVQARVQYIKLNNQLLPISTSPTYQPQDVSFTVQNFSAWIGFAFADKVATTGDNIYYIRAGSIFINNSIGQPAVNQEVSISIVPKTYGVGLWKFIPKLAGTPAVTDKDGVVTIPAIPEVPAKWTNQSFMNGSTIGGTFSCLSEDFNRNATLDSGEDYNGDSMLTPLNPITVLAPNGTQILSTQTVKTDATGKLDFSIRYGKEYAQWMIATVRVTTKVDGSEFSQERDINLPVLADDVITEDNRGIRPNTISPFGTLVTSTMLPYCSFIPSNN